jgi:signal transduction histidine kinase
VRLSNFILINMEVILGEWEDFARTVHPNAATVDAVELRDHAEGMLRTIAADIATEQTERQSIDKALGRLPRGEGESMAETHAVTRMEAGFTIDQLVAEYRALRASVLRLWEQRIKTTTAYETLDMTRFNEAIDQALAESVARYTTMVQESQHLFLAILGHDVRTPLSAIRMGAHVLMLDETLPSKHLKVASRILGSAERMGDIVSDLLDFTAAHLGNGIPVKPSSTDLAIVCRDVVEEMRTVHADRTIFSDLSGDLQGHADRTRICQALSNLVNNAVQHGSSESPVTVTAKGTLDKITLSVHNKGEVISPAVQQILFDPVKQRALRLKHDREGRVQNLGLGLYIASEIVKAHSGHITIASAAEEGTTFTIHLPRSLR